MAITASRPRIKGFRSEFSGALRQRQRALTMSRNSPVSLRFHSLSSSQRAMVQTRSRTPHASGRLEPADETIVEFLGPARLSSGSRLAVPLRLLPHAQAADPGEPNAAAFRQGAGQGPRLCRRLPRRLPRTALHRPLRCERSNQRCEIRRLNPLGGETLDKPPACPPRPQENKSRRSGHSMCYQNRTT